MATFVKNPKGSWKAVIRKHGWPTIAKTFRTKRDAEDWARRTEDEMVRGVYVRRSSSERLTFRSALDRYLAEVTPSKKPATQQAEILKSKPLLEFFGDYSLAAITPELVARYRDERLSARAYSARRSAAKATIKPNTVRLELALLSHLFTIAIKEWQLGLIQNPVANIRKPRVGAGRDRRLTKNEEQDLAAALANYSNPMLGWIFRIAIETGMRSGEITGLKLRQVDLERRIARLTQTKNDGARTVPLSKAAVAALQDAVENPTRPKGCDLVFFGEPGRDGRRRAYNFNKAWAELKKQLGIEDLRFHDLRHEAVSRFVEAGFSDQEVSAISGHRSMQMLKRYTHLRAEDLVKRLDGDR